MDNLDYGIIGNCRSSALISKTGSIDWACLPDFNSSSAFAKLLDEKKGGEFSFIVDDDYEIKQSYIDNTNILVTRFKKNKSIFEVVDFMPRFIEGDRYHYPADIVRFIRHVSGAPECRVNYNPKLGYAKHETLNSIESNYIKSSTENGTYESIYLYSDLNLNQVFHGERIKIKKNHYFLVSYNQKILEPDVDKIYLEFERTKVYWLDWAHRTKKFRRYNDEIMRSALVLKLLTYQKSGSILAAATTSLPETIGEVRNWDYRYCWIRDASMTISILTNLGHFSAAERFLNFILDLIPFKDEKVQIMYGIRGEKKLTERILEHLDGYEGSKPVRVGNAAYIQKQNDIYGVLLDVILKNFRLFENDIARSEELWTIVRSLVKIVEKNWRKPDMGIWELRTSKKHFVFSKVLCWTALDRGAKIAHLLGKDSYAEDWAKTREVIKNDILKKGWNNEIKSFTQSYGSDAVDAANLLMATYGFIEPKDPLYVMTVKKTRERLCKDGLMYRYKNEDDFGLPSSSFTVCTFWMIKSLYLIGEKEEAKKMFEKLISYSNHLGLLSEDIDFKSKRLLGNFPQAYSHLALIDSAIVLSDMEFEEDEKLINALEKTKR